VALLGAVLAPAQAPPAAAAVDPFYTSRLQEGIAAADRHAYAEAAQSFRVACFGMLDDEAQLADCLVRLSLAQAAAGDRDGFAQTFRRLQEGEELVGLYSKASLPRELSAPFEAKVGEWIPRAALATFPAFQKLLADPREAQLAALAPRARRERLAQLEKEDPRQPRWPLLAARLGKEQGEAKAALGAADRALRLDGKLAEARCLRGWANSQLGKHGEALGDLAGCLGADAAFAIAQLQSRVALEQWQEAAALLTTLPPDQRRLQAVEGLAAKVERQATKAAGGSRPAPPAEVRPAAGGTPSPVVTPSPPASASRGAVAGAPSATAPMPPGGALPSADESLLARAQAALGKARTAAEVEQAYTLAAGLALRYPSHPRVQHTAAEIAYRASRWGDAVRHFRQGGDPGEAQPLLLFYYAVSLWESGARDEAAAVMRRCEGKLRPTPFVQAYRGKILGALAGS
jgi:hypothetical protein